MSNLVAKPEKSVSVKIVNAFVRNNMGGNPAGVVLDADNLHEDDMQAIAAQTGLSETAFVSRSDTAAFKLDFFTPTRRIAHCGHATIGTFSVLASLGHIGEGASSKETVDGPRAIEIADGAAFMEQLAPTYSNEGEWGGRETRKADVLRSLGLTAADLMDNGDPIVVDTGNRFMLIGVRNVGILKDLAGNRSLIEAISDDLDLIGYYVYAITEDREVVATTRMFAPRYGIAEEAATGMAAGPLGCLLFDRHDFKVARLQIEQGRYMIPASVSVLDVQLNLNDNHIASLMVGGFGKIMTEQTVQY